MDKLITFDLGDMRVRVLLDRGFFNVGQKLNSPPHSHSDYEMHFVFEDHIEFESDNGKILVAENEVCLFPRGFLHRPLTECSGGQRTSLRFSVKKLARPKNEGEYADIVLSKLEKVQILHSLPSFSAELKSIINETYAHRLFSTERLTAMFALFFSSLFSHLISCTSDDELSGSSPDDGDSDIRFAMIEEFFTYNYMHDVTLSDLAAHLHLSTKQTQRMIQRAFNATFKEQLSRQRMSVAKMLLLDSDMQVKDIAAMIGFKSYGGFYNLFHKEVGVPPAEYRKQKGQIFL